MLFLFLQSKHILGTLSKGIEKDAKRHEECLYAKAIGIWPMPREHLSMRKTYMDMLAFMQRIISLVMPDQAANFLPSC